MTFISDIGRLPKALRPRLRGDCDLEFNDAPIALPPAFVNHPFGAIKS
ncbi:MAG: hypothetical protein ACNYPD_05805 [Candidatus Halichondribacter symbioticus]